MGRYFKCMKCGNDTFSDEGIYLFRENEFQGLKCNKCSNTIFLEVKSSKFRQILVRFEEKEVLKLLKK